MYEISRQICDYQLNHIFNEEFPFTVCLTAAHRSLTEHLTTLTRLPRTVRPVQLLAFDHKKGYATVLSDPDEKKSRTLGTVHLLKMLQASSSSPWPALPRRAQEKQLSSNGEFM